MRETANLSRRAAVALPLAALIRPAAVDMPVPATATSDPVLAQIVQHRVLRVAVQQASGEDDDSVYVSACNTEEAALQALGEARPTTVAGAAALLAYMAEVEGCYADPGSPLLRTVLSVARGLSDLSRRTA